MDVFGSSNQITASCSRLPKGLALLDCQRNKIYIYIPGKKIFCLCPLCYQKEYNFIAIGLRGYSSEAIGWDVRLINKKGNTIITEVIPGSNDAGGRREKNFLIDRVAF